MSDSEPSRNGTEESGERVRPSWYIEFEPLADDRTGEEVLIETFGNGPLEMSEEEAAYTLAYLEQFRVPRDK